MMLPIRLDRKAAAAIAGASADEGALYAYPLLGAVFRVTRARGPARGLVGSLAHAIVDKATGHAQTCDPWALVEVPAHAVLQDVASLPTRRLLSDAHGAVAHRLRATWKLAARIELELAEFIDPLYKPNWFFQTPTHRVLVDAVTGKHVTASR